MRTCPGESRSLPSFNEHIIPQAPTLIHKGSVFIKKMNRTLALYCLLMTLLSFASSKSFAQPPQTAASSDVNTFGVVKGIVVDPGGTPVKGAHVYEGGIRFYVTGENSPPTNLRNNETTSNANGEFVLDQVIPSKSVIIHAYEDTDYYAF